jgi:nickel superoxide dismutase
LYGLGRPRPDARVEEETALQIRPLIERLVRPGTMVYAHCDLPCGIYDPAQARIEAESVRAVQERYQNAEQMKGATQSIEDYHARALKIKEERADLVKHHLWVLWTDYFTPAHLEKYPQLHDIFWRATKEAGLAKRSQDPAQGQKLLDAIAEIDKIFWETKQPA